eukprot:c18430_g1_i1.p1 GENE.c18430_g1_i1~~c18430_g1_i1.p1  ORF type:complete len:677 (-),score=49.80 c18430_g1_i1:120-2150(-)
MAVSLRNISGNQLGGTLPSEICKLTLMTFCDISANKLSGTMPTEIGALSRLSSWDLSSNRFRGRIPSEIGNAVALQHWSVRNNHFSGALPSQIGLLTSLERFDAASNRLTGRIPSTVPRRIAYLTLHHNQLTGSIPSQIGLLQHLELLSLFDNRLSGSVPPLHLPSNLLLLFNNLLSCSLPSHTLNTNNSSPTPPQTLVALGNVFVIDGWSNRINAQRWLYKWDSDSTHLFEVYPRIWTRQLCLLVCCMLVAASVHWLRPVVDFVPPLWTRCWKVGLGLTAFALIYVIVLSSSTHMHECPNPILRVTLAELRLSNANRASLGALTCSVIHLVSCVAVSRWLRRDNSVGTSASRERTLISLSRSLCLMIVWVVIISVLHVPVLLYLLSESFPSNNRFNMNLTVVTLLRGLVSPWLVFSGEWLIPVLSVWLTSKYYYNQMNRNASLLRSERVSHTRTSTEMVLVSQLFSLVVAPIVSQILLHNRCIGITGRFWQPCQEPNAFNINVIATITVPTKEAFNVTFPVLREDEVCGLQFDAELCQRAVVASITTLSVSKVIYQTLFVLLRALLAMGLANRNRPSRFQRLERFIQNLTEPTEDASTISIVSLLLVGFALGGAAPLIWPAVFFGIHSTALLWRCSSRAVENQSAKLVGRRVVWFSLAAQLGLVFWFVFVQILSS